MSLSLFSDATHEFIHSSYFPLGRRSVKFQKILLCLVILHHPSFLIILLASKTGASHQQVAVLFNLRTRKFQKILLCLFIQHKKMLVVISKSCVSNCWKKNAKHSRPTAFVDTQFKPVTPRFIFICPSHVKQYRGGTINIHRLYVVEILLYL